MMRRFRLFPRLKTLFLADAGHVAVEYALTAPILLGMIYGIVEVSHYAFLKMTISNAAHDAVRYAIVHSSSSTSPLGSSSIQSYATNELTGLGLNGAAATVNVNYGNGNSPGSTVQVNISYPFTPFMPGFNAIPLSSATFTALAGPITTTSQMVFGQ